jgi:hypothetical protein
MKMAANYEARTCREGENKTTHNSVGTKDLRADLKSGVHKSKRKTLFVWMVRNYVLEEKPLEGLLSPR